MSPQNPSNMLWRSTRASSTSTASRWETGPDYPSRLVSTVSSEDQPEEKHYVWQVEQYQTGRQEAEERQRHVLAGELPQQQRAERDYEHGFRHRGSHVEEPHLLYLSRARAEKRYPDRTRHEIEQYDRGVAHNARDHELLTRPAQQDRRVESLGDGGDEEEEPVSPPLLEMLRYYPQVDQGRTQREPGYGVQDGPGGSYKAAGIGGGQCALFSRNGRGWGGCTLSSQRRVAILPAAPALPPSPPAFLSMPLTLSSVSRARK